jgi:hypothetical protein
MAETFVGLMKLSPHSILNEPFSLRPGICPEERKDKFGMADILAYVDKNSAMNELNPLGDV